MGVITYTWEQPSRGIQIYTWETLTNGDTGTPVAVPHFSDKTVQFTGTFDTTTILIEGSNDSGASPVYATLTDPQGNGISKTAAAIETVLENPLIIRPSCTAGGASTDIDVKLIITTTRS